MKKITLLLLILLAGANLVSGQGFNSIYSPDGISVVAVGNSGLTFKSQNGGTSWSENTIAATDLKYVHGNGNDVYIATTTGKILKTNLNLSPVTTIQTAIAGTINSIHFVNANTGYICADGGFVYKTVNAGLNWTNVSTGITPGNLNSVHFYDANNGIVAGANGTCYITTNGGTLWVSQVTGTTRNLLRARIYSDGATVAGEWGVMLRKPAAGVFTAVNTRTTSDIRAITGSSNAAIHVAGGGGFIRNNIGPNPDFKNFETNPMLANLVDIYYVNSTTGFAVSSLNKAIIKTVDSGTNWNLTAGTIRTLTWVQKSPNGQGIGNTLCMHPRFREGMYVTYGSQIYRSYDYGETWTQFASWTSNSSARAHSFYVSGVDSNIMVAAIASSPDRVIRSTDHGVTWTTVHTQNFSNYGQPLEMDQNNNNIFYFAPDNGGFWKSTNGGANFTEISGNYPFRSPCDIIVDYENSNIVFVGDGVTGSGQAKMFKSTNGGVNWTDVLTTTASEIPSITNTIFEPNKLYCTEWSGSNIYKTTNKGDTWVNSHNTGFSGWASGFCMEDPSVIMTGNYGSNSALSTNSGANWTYNAPGLSGSGAGMIVPTRGVFMNQMTGRLYKLQITYSVITTVTQNGTNVPQEYSLSQNYPNPFNPTTKIKFDIPSAGNVKLLVYNQLGEMVSTLFNGYTNAGSYEKEFDASGLSSGIYFYKLITPNQTFTRKMMLVK